MLKGALPFADAVCTVWVGHKLKELTILNKFIHQNFCIAVMHIIITGAMDVQ